MADVKVIRIEVIGGASDESSGDDSSNGKKNKFSKELYEITHPLQTTLKNKMGPKAYAASYRAYQYAKQAVTNYASIQVNRYITLKEDYLAGNTINAVKTTISKINGLGSSVMGGALAGATFGPVGIGIGAFVGAVSFGINEHLNYQSRISNYYQSLNATCYQTNFGATRAGLINNSQGTEN